MSAKNSMLAEKDLLRRKPTVGRWEVELERIREGEREADINELGGIDEYVDRLIARSKDRPLARACFRKALRQVIRMWQPSDRETKEYVYCTLELIGAYTPAEGAAKILGFFKAEGSFEDLEAVGGQAAGVDLDETALQVLENFFEARPYHKLRAEVSDYADYVQVLRRMLRDGRHAAYAAARLAQMGLLDLDEREVGALFEKNPSAINSFVSLAFDPARLPHLDSDLRKIAAHALGAGPAAVQVLEQILNAYGARLERRGRTPVVVLENDKEIEVAGVHYLPAEGAAAAAYESHADQMPSVTLDELPGYLKDALTDPLKNISKNDRARVKVSETLDFCLQSFGRPGAKYFKKFLESGGAEIRADNDILIRRENYTFRPLLSPRAKMIFISEVRWDPEVLPRQEKKIILRRLERMDKNLKPRKGKPADMRRQPRWHEI